MEETYMEKGNLTPSGLLTVNGTYYSLILDGSRVIVLASQTEANVLSALSYIGS